MGNLGEETLEAWLERTIRERIAADRRIIAIERAPFPHVGSYDCEYVTVTIRGAGKVVLFLKDFGHSRLPKDQPAQRRLRELHVYEELLDEATLGTPRFYGTMADQQTQRYWMLLEYVDADVVEEIDAQNGSLAVSWLARMQRHFLNRGAQLEQCDFLLRHDTAYFHGKAAAARRDALGIAPTSHDRIEAIIDFYLAGADLLLSQPMSLVHGGFIPWHILVDRSADPARVCVVDWELAAIGATLYDVAMFIDDAPPELHENLRDMYHAAALRHGVPVSDPDEMLATIDRFRLHRVVDWLSRGVEKQYSARKVEWLLQRAEALRDALEHAGR